MSIILNGTTGITTPDIQSAAGLDATDINDGAVTAAKLHTTAVTDKLGYTPVNKAGDTITGNLVISGGSVITHTAGGSISASGDNILNLENLFGLYTAGLLIIRGNENGVNQTQRLYMWTISYYGGSSTRWVGLKELGSKQIENSYGSVHAYLGNWAGSYTSSDQSHSGTSTTTSNIYFRSAAGSGCTYSYTIWRTG
jgi:hypothetical protein